MANAKAKTVKTVKTRVAVIYNAEGKYQAGGYEQRRRLSDAELIGDAKNLDWTTNPNELPHACIVDIELPIPEPLEGKVLNVRQVKR